MFSSIGHSLLLAFGFGFVIFWHELGHFLAAKWADVRVEQFAVGFGQAIFSWRKGLGFRWGSTQKDYHECLVRQVYKDRIVPGDAPNESATGSGSTLSYSEPGSKPVAESPKQQFEEPTEAQLLRAAAEIPVSETEYRLNWIPLGGYVKMMGQDDLKPGVEANDPRSYTNKPVGKRMVIVSAGVIMNVILAAVLFTYIFSVGFEVTPPVVGGVLAGSPGSQTFKLVGDKKVPAPLQVGDTILELNGKPQSDFEKISLNTSLSIPDEMIPMTVQRAATGQIETVYITPRKSSPDAQFPQIGVEPYRKLTTFPKPEKVTADDAKDLADLKSRSLPEDFKLEPGETVVAANKIPLKDYRQLVEIQQEGRGKPLTLTVKNSAGGLRSEVLPSHFDGAFSGIGSVTFAGMEMLPTIESIQDKKSPAIGKLMPGDVVTAIADAVAGGKRIAYPTSHELLEFIRQAGVAETEIRFTVLRNGKELTAAMTPSISIEPHKKGIGIQIGIADGDPIVADVAKGSPAADAGLPSGARLTAIDDQPVDSWLQVAAVMRNLPVGKPYKVEALVNDKPVDYTFKGLTQDQLDQVTTVRYTSGALAMLAPDTFTRIVPTGHVWTAGWWGCGETRDAVLQVYLTIRSMVKGSISPTQVSGPVGILSAGYKIAERGTTRLIWFLAIISANLAVMNFLPIPIVDGGLMTFLIIEKVKGSPVSQRVQVMAQYVGLALLLSVFVFATYQDIYRLPF